MGWTKKEQIVLDYLNDLQEVEEAAESVEKVDTLTFGALRKRPKSDDPEELDAWLAEWEEFYKKQATGKAKQKAAEEGTTLARVLENLPPEMFENILVATVDRNPWKNALQEYGRVISSMYIALSQTSRLVRHRMGYARELLTRLDADFLQWPSLQTMVQKGEGSPGKLWKELSILLRGFTYARYWVDDNSTSKLRMRYGYPSSYVKSEPTALALLKSVMITRQDHLTAIRMTAQRVYQDEDWRPMQSRLDEWDVHQQGYLLFERTRVFMHPIPSVVMESILLQPESDYIRLAIEDGRFYDWMLTEASEIWLPTTSQPKVTEIQLVANSHSGQDLTKEDWVILGYKTAGGEDKVSLNMELFEPRVQTRGRPLLFPNWRRFIIRGHNAADEENSSLEDAIMPISFVAINEDATFPSTITEVEAPVAAWYYTTQMKKNKVKLLIHPDTASQYRIGDDLGDILRLVASDPNVTLLEG